jgi:predicted Zn-dependent peptidase
MTSCLDQQVLSNRMIENVQITRLPNGLTILSEHMPELRSVSLGIWLRRGSRHETSDQNGICHFIEHALFQRQSPPFGA